MTTHQRPSLWAASGIFFITFMIYILWPGQFSTGDGRWVLPTALSLLHEGNTELSEFQRVISLPDYALYTDAEGRLYNYFPLGASLLIMPPAWLAEVLIERALPGINLYDHTQAFRALGVELMLASGITAAAVALFYLLAVRQTGYIPALLATLVFAFGTGAWSMTSRTLWMHGPLLLIFTCLLISLYRASLNTRWLNGWLVMVGFLTAFSYVIRPTASVWVVLVTLYVLWTYRRRSLFYFIGAALVAVPFLLYNLSTYQLLLPPYYEGSRIALHDRFGEALLGNLISPARGVLLYSPVLIVALWGAFTRWRRGCWQLLDTMLWGGVLLHWLAVSSFPGWWGGVSNGPRFMLDVLPFLLLYVAYGVEALLSAPHDTAFEVPRWVRAGGLGVFALLAAFSVFIHGTMATQQAAQTWDFAPFKIERTTARLWDWADPPFLRPYRALEDTSSVLALNDLRFEFDNAFDLYVAEGILQWVESTASGRSFQWMSTPGVVFYLPLARERDLMFDLALANVIQEDLLDTLEVRINDVPLELTEVERIEGFPVYRARIPQEVLAKRNTYSRVEIRVERTYRPADLGLGGDTRDVSIALDYMHFYPARRNQ